MLLHSTTKADKPCQKTIRRRSYVSIYATNQSQSLRVKQVTLILTDFFHKLVHINEKHQKTRRTKQTKNHTIPCASLVGSVRGIPSMETSSFFGCNTTASPSYSTRQCSLVTNVQILIVNPKKIP